MQHGDTVAANTATGSRACVADQGSKSRRTPARLIRATTLSTGGKGSFRATDAAAAVAIGAVKLRRETMDSGRLELAYRAPITPPVPTRPLVSSIPRCRPSGFSRTMARTDKAAKIPNSVLTRITNGVATPACTDSLTPTCIAAMQAAERP
eukprot:scaffold174713_cov43-Prasinocladus_malaysianus.AAC.1